MKIMKYLYKGFLSIFNYPYIPKEIIKDIKGPLLLHISDTPMVSYNYIFRVIKILKPQYIIHTGDLVDNIKLEIYRNRVEQYETEVELLIRGLEKNESTKIFYVLGNHDDYKTVSQLINRGEIIQEGELLSIEECKFVVGHYPKDYSYDVDFYLYGHSFYPKHHIKNGTTGLNGLLNINVIDLSTKEVFHINYPIGTDSSRRMKFNKFGL
ncbi:MAG: metallophosphoesterase [Clostridiaceae bacterium]|nr:metallophosphoesterase [Clostridiaceae bacterium]